jgi:hypothetical protein
MKLYKSNGGTHIAYLSSRQGQVAIIILWLFYSWHLGGPMTCPDVMAKRWIPTRYQKWSPSHLLIQHFTKRMFLFLLCISLIKLIIYRSLEINERSCKLHILSYLLAHKLDLQMTVLTWSPLERFTYCFITQSIIYHTSILVVLLSGASMKFQK